MPNDVGQTDGHGSAGNASGHGDAGHHKSGDRAQTGQPGDPAKAGRIIDIVMTDTAYNFPDIVIRQGETIRFRVQNTGELLHEFNIGTATMHAAHQREMQRMVDAELMDATALTPSAMPHDDGAMNHQGDLMRHDDPNALLLEPGSSGEVTWSFTNLPAEKAVLQFACNVPGHYEAGMVGQFRFVPPNTTGALPTPSRSETEE